MITDLTLFDDIDPVGKFCRDQLHFCVGYVVSEMLDEVTFISEQTGRLCGLIVEKGAGCSLYANVDREILSGDFTALGPEVMLSGIALSLTEDVIDNK